jgi:ABC-type nickel/cobalt efflux system permease component RcnA
MPDLLQITTAFLLGLVHSIDVDHAVAVSTLVAGRPAWPVAIGYGLRWGLGHSVAVLIAGITVLGLGLRIDPRLDHLAERLVGVMLIGLGILALRTLGNLHLHRPPAHGDHAHLHTHGPVRPHEHPHRPPPDRQHHPARPLLVGLVHGLAGSSGVLALAPVALIDQWWTGLGYLAAFSLGVTGGMVLFALGLAEAIRRATSRSLAWGRRIGLAIALASIVTGGWWILTPS